MARHPPKGILLSEQIATQPATDASLCSRAFVLLGENVISSLEEGSSTSVIAKALYSGVYEEFLTSHPWPFCIFEGQLNRRADEAPEIDEYKYVYQLPAALLQLEEIVPNDLHYTIISKRRLLSNATELKARYVAKIPENLIPPAAQTALVYRLAAEFAIPITSSKTRMDLFLTLYADQMKRARHVEARQRPSKPLYGSAGLVNGRGEGW